MKFYKYSQKEENYFEVEFDYSESCKNVYKTFSVHKNGSRSNIVSLRKGFQGVEPEILSQNTYFWHGAGSASSRRSNEERRNGQVYEFFTGEGWSETETFYLENNNLRGKEKFGIDTLGYFLEYRNFRYHFGFVKSKKITGEMFTNAREMITKQRESVVKEYHDKRQQDEREQRKQAALPRIWVSLEDSLLSGNCEVGTAKFAADNEMQDCGAIRADYLLELRNDHYTRRAVDKAIEIRYSHVVA